MAQVNITTIPRHEVGWQSDNAAMAARDRTDGGKVLHPSTVQILGERFLERFWVFVRKTDTCWLWMAGKDKDGYGQIHRVGKGPIKVHRASWILSHGPITSKQHVLHHCDVRNCVNPDHLFLGDQAINMKDAAAKGRLHGCRRPRARRLSDADEQRIHDIYAVHGGRLPRGLRAELAQRFDVSGVYISLLGRGHRVRALRTA